jgi:putative oxidoreductase
MQSLNEDKKLGHRPTFHETQLSIQISCSGSPASRSATFHPILFLHSADPALLSSLRQVVPASSSTLSRGGVPIIFMRRRAGKGAYSMFHWLAKPAFAGLILRLMLAAIFICQGGLKILKGQGGLSWFDSSEFPLPSYVQALVAWGELACGVALLIGLGTRLASLGIIVIMVGAIYTVTWRRDFTSLPTSRGFLIEVGYEYNYAIIAMCTSLIILGAGALSVDYLLWRRKPEASAAPPPAS